MSTEYLTKLVGELAEVIKFHELATVDSKAAELLLLVKTLQSEKPEEVAEETDAWFEELRQANLINTTR